MSLAFKLAHPPAPAAHTTRARSFFRYLFSSICCSINRLRTPSKTLCEAKKHENCSMISTFSAQKKSQTIQKKQLTKFTHVQNSKHWTSILPRFEPLLVTFCTKKARFGQPVGPFFAVAGCSTKPSQHPLRALHRSPAAVSENSFKSEDRALSEDALAMRLRVGDSIPAYLNRQYGFSPITLPGGLYSATITTAPPAQLACPMPTCVVLRHTICV